MEPARPFVSVHLILKQDGKLFLMKRQYSIDHNGKYVFVAGKIDAHETPTQAIVREAREEIGIELDLNALKPLSVIYRTAYPYGDVKLDVIEFFIQATSWSGDPCIQEPDKCSDIGFFAVNDLPENVSESVMAFITEATSNYIEVQGENWADCKTVFLTGLQN